MSGSGSKWLAGCGIGCGALLLLLIAVGTWGYLYVKGKMHSFAEAETAGKELRQEYGEIEDFCPAPDGKIAPERIRVFLNVRERLAPVRRNLEAAFAGLSDGIEHAKEGQDSIPQILEIIGQGFGVIPQLGDFELARTRALHNCGMGPGEYFYIYVLAYYSWLGKSPADGPEFRIQGQGDIISDDSREGRDVRQERLEALTRHVRRVFLAMLRNQLAKLDQGRAEAPAEAWRSALEAEIAAMESSPSRLPWQGNVPKTVEGSLQPFRDRLEESYSPLTNPLELWTRTAGRPKRGW